MARTYPDLCGCKVRLNRDVTTRGGTTFRKGVVMRVRYQDHRTYHLFCTVRAKSHGLTLPKSDYKYRRIFTVVERPKENGTDSEG